MLLSERAILSNQASLAKGEFENHLKDGETEAQEWEGLTQSQAVHARTELISQSLLSLSRVLWIILS